MALAARTCDGHAETLAQPAKGTFGDAFVYLVREHEYDVNVVNSQLTAPPGIATFDFR
jgi:hypothetical protein